MKTDPTFNLERPAPGGFRLCAGPLGGWASKLESSMVTGA